jgi:tryptophan synthase alpha chain
MLTPTSPPERIQRVSSLATGFIYYVSLKGVTGAATLDVDAVAAKLAQIKQYTDKPVAVGFGINSPEVARKIAHIADAVIVGSAVVKLVEQTPETAECLVQVGEFVNSLRKAMDQV